MKKAISIFILTFLFQNIHAQTVKGTVIDENMEVLIGATVHWAGTSIGDATDEMGEFMLIGNDIEDKRIVVTYVGYLNDTINILGDADYMVEMISDAALSEVIVEGQKTGGFISSSSPMKIEIINDVELGKAACCDLAGCFNTNASVEPATTNIVTNSKELKILGLSGIYNQLLLDGQPLIQGLSYSYGISSVPGPFVEQIFISKGTNSVLQGAESISGQINVILQKPEKAPILHVNLFLNSFLESQYNVYGTYDLGKSKHFVGVHMVQPAAKWDRNDDNFLDLPKLTRYEILDKWTIGNEQKNGYSNRGGIRFTNERRVGGQENFDPKTDLGSSTVYGQQIKYNQFDIWDRNAYRFNEKNAMALILSGQYHQQDAWFGETNYDGRQTLFNATLQHEWIYKNGSNLRAGASFKYLDLDEEISFTNNPLEKSYDGTYETKEIVPGIFAENTFFSKDNKMTFMLGLKADHLNIFGWKLSPRSLIKFTPKEKTDIRISAGYGWHRPKVFAEQANVLSSQRDVHIHQLLQPDEAWNYGINITQKFETTNMSGSVTADYYQTRFTNHVQPHYHEFHDAIVFENNSRPAVGNGFQIESSFDLWEWINIKLSYNFLDMQHHDIEDGEKQSMNFITKHKFLTSLSVAPKGKPWHLDVNSQWYGKKSLPDTQFYPDDFQQSDYSKPYSMLNAQFTYKWKAFEWYAGVENILNFTQDNPIISADNPYNPYFDTSFAWGPIRGTEGYVGFRYTLERKEDGE
jgi:outer membrane receptor for ferrienterochelin and colicins